MRTALGLLLALPALAQRVEVLRGGSEELKGVFFSGKPWLVQCVSAADITAASESGKAAVEASHAVLQLALGSLPKEVDVGLLDCKKRLPSGKNSGKNTLERFRLDDGISPLLMLFANARPPIQLTPALLNKAGLSTQLFPSARQQAAALVNLVTSRAEPKLWPVTKTEQLHDICVKKGRHCALILHQGELKSEATRSLKALLPEFRTVHFVSWRGPVPLNPHAAPRPSHAQGSAPHRHPTPHPADHSKPGALRLLPRSQAARSDARRATAAWSALRPRRRRGR